MKTDNLMDINKTSNNMSNVSKNMSGQNKPPTAITTDNLEAVRRKILSVIKEQGADGIHEDTLETTLIRSGFNVTEIKLAVKDIEEKSEIQKFNNII